MKKRKSHLPTGLYRKVNKATGVAYYQYLNRVTRKYIGLGTDEETAIREAERLNLLHADIRSQLKAGAFFRNGVPCLRGGAIELDGMYSAGSVIAASRPVDTIAGIYFLIENEQIVYVGQSRDALTRLSSHCRAGEKRFSRFVVLECDHHQLDELEARYISKFNPPLNIVKPSADGAKFWRNIGEDLEERDEA